MIQVNNGTRFGQYAYIIIIYGYDKYFAYGITDSSWCSIAVSSGIGKYWIEVAIKRSDGTQNIFTQQVSKVPCLKYNSYSRNKKSIFHIHAISTATQSTLNKSVFIIIPIYFSSLKIDVYITGVVYFEKVIHALDYIIFHATSSTTLALYLLQIKRATFHTHIVK
jgi:hypothetical protein